MTDRAALLAAVLADPADDTPRLIFADYLDETGDPADAARAAFVRAEVAAEGLPPGSPDRVRLESEAARLFNAHGEVWKRDLLAGADRPDVRAFYRRGFIEDVELSIQAFVAHAAELFAAVPVTTLRLTLPYSSDPVPPLSVFGMRPELARITTLQLGPYTLTTAGGGWLAEPTLFDDLLSSPTLTGLRRLILDGNPFDAAWLMAFAARLPGATFTRTLEELSLADCQLTDTEAAVLLAARGLDRVTRLNLSGNRISPAAATVIRERFGDGLVL
jgi:uncharacterized protein (TIGR02996 family)